MKNLIKYLKFILVALACLVFVGYAHFIETNKLELNKYVIQDSQLKGVKIVFASDFHIKPYLTHLSFIIII